MSDLVWLCKEHYYEECKKIGREIPIYTIYNYFKSACEAEGCDRVAEHLIDNPEQENQSKAVTL